jgi:hypothetical protein
MRELIVVKDSRLVQSGLKKDVALGQEGIWRDGENMLFIDGAMEKSPGWAVKNPVGKIVRAIAQSFGAGPLVRRIYYATNDNYIYVDINGTITTLGAAFIGDGNWSLTPWGTWLLATNGEEQPKIAKTMTNGSMATITNLASLSFLPAFFRKMNNHVLAFKNQEVKFSSRDNPELWVPSGTNTAGNLLPREFDSDIRAAEPLGQAMAVYSADTMMVLQYVGGDIIFGFAGTTINGIGAVSEKSVIPRGNRNYGLSRKGIFVTDGVGFSYIDAPDLNRYIQDTVNWEYAKQIVGMNWESKNLLCWWFRPVGGGSRQGVGYNPDTGEWMKLRMEVWAASEQQEFDYPIVGTNDHYGFLGSGLNLGTLAMPASVQTFHGDAGTRDRFKDWDMLRVEREYTGSIEYRLGFNNNLEDAIEWTAWSTLQNENWIHRSSIYMYLGFRSNGLNQKIRLGSFEILGEMGAYR